jgi:hypothetical protein
MNKTILQNYLDIAFQLDVNYGKKLREAYLDFFISDSIDG